MTVAAARKFDPANDQHYALSMNDQMIVKEARDALDGIGLWLRMDTDGGRPHDDLIGAMISTIGYTLEAVLDDRMVFQSRQR